MVFGEKKLTPKIFLGYDVLMSKAFENFEAQNFDIVTYL